MIGALPLVVSSLPLVVLACIVALGLAQPGALWAGVPVLLAVGSIAGFGGGDGIGMGGELAKVVLALALVVSAQRVPTSFLLIIATWAMIVLVAAFRSDLGSGQLFVVALGWLAPAAAAGAALGARRPNSSSWFLRGILALQVLTLVQLLEVYVRLGITISAGAAYKQYLVAGVGASNMAAATACLGMAIAVAWPKRQLTVTKVLIWGAGLAIIALSMSKWGVVVAFGLLLVLLILAFRRSSGLGLAVLVGIVTVTFGGFKLSAVSEVRAGGLELAAYSTGSGRQEIWSAYWHVFLDSPLLGSGLGWADTSALGSPILAHNVLLQLLGEGGLLLLTCYLFMFLWLATRAWHRTGPRVWLLVGIALLNSMMEPAMGTPRYEILLFAALGFLSRDDRASTASLRTGRQDALRASATATSP